ncbi:acyltransferase domain-containing protein [Ascidiimonas sp. W6]|uniref:acyltransferase domain-containing protein n=1 Tax=Ascidiimonas meishanensis TaxID=3128903 RepID=UPI0030ECF5A9
MKNHKIIFLFSGQGSQYRGMGQSLYEKNLVFRASLEKSDLIVRQLLNRSLIYELYESKDKDFDELLITHPAIVAVEIAMFEVLQSMNINPDYVCGNSLGEFAAAFASNVWDLETAIRFSIEQAKTIVNTGLEGGMLAVIDNEKKLDKQRYLDYDLFLASDNFEGHYTLSGSVKNLDSFQIDSTKKGVNFVRLPVKIPFHSSLLFNELSHVKYPTINNLGLRNPTSGFVSGMKCKELNILPTNYFEQVISLYMNYTKTINYLEEKGACFYIDLGPSGTSATFTKYNLDTKSNSKTFQIMTPFKREVQQLNELKNYLN